MIFREEIESVISPFHTFVIILGYLSYKYLELLTYHAEIDSATPSTSTNDQFMAFSTLDGWIEVTLFD
jgi:hypothetical protein